MLIGELSKVTGCTKDTIRFYEKKGLIHKLHKRDEKNNYKIYGKESIDTILLIQQAKTFGFTLKEIRSLLDALENETLSVDYMLNLCKEKLGVVRRKAAELNVIKERLEKKIENLSLGSCEM